MQNNNGHPINYVYLYLTDQILQHIVNETNHYAEQYIEEHPDKITNNYTGRWTPIDVDELKKFWGLILLTGIIKKPALHLYWSTKELYNTPVFSKIMKRDRFLLILKFLHFNDNRDPNYDNTDENRDCLHKVRHLIDFLRSKFQRVFQPGKHLSVDESLVLYKGRLHFKQYIRTKRARFGIKLYKLTTSNGITLDFLVYCGKGMFDEDDPNSDMPSTERIPTVLMQNFFGKGHVLYTDNFYTSPSLASYFLEHDTHICGTVRKNQINFSKDIVAVQLVKGTSAFCKVSDKPIMACKYRSHKDKANNQQKVVYMLSTCHQPIVVNTNKKDRYGEFIYKPKVVKDYIMNMGGVDQINQQLSLI